MQKDNPVLPPGTLLQLMYVKERLRSIPPGRFIEIGPGSGEITSVLLEAGWVGVSYDLEAKTVDTLKVRFADEIAAKHYMPVNENFLDATPEKADLIISCMVMEHLDDNLEQTFMQQSMRVLRQGGCMIGLVPGSPEHWGIEDDIAGHCRRYTRDTVKALADANGWMINHMAGLTFPVSNVLLPLSNFLVNRSERSKLALSALERTKLSGRRDVSFKTHFPNLLRLVLNPLVMMPFHWIQKVFSTSAQALVIYFELKPTAQPHLRSGAA